MGTNVGPLAPSGLADALFTPVQRRVLGLLFGQPDRRFQSAELIRLAGSGTGAVHRQLQRLAEAGLVDVEREGNQKYYRARRESPIFDELHGIAIKTTGLVEPLRAALAPLARGIHAAFVFGSVAQGTDRATSDIDLFVVSDKVEYPEVYAVLAAVEKRLGRQVNPTVMTGADWRKRTASDTFASRVATRPRIFLIGSANDLA
jgi:predicted nucleotidyltransferase